MSKITDKADLNVGTELIIDTTARTIELAEAGGLAAKDGVTFQAIYSKCIDLWETAAYNQFPFPFYAIDALSGQFQIGFDGTNYNTWAWADDTTRQMIRDAGWDEFTPTTPNAAGTSSTGTLSRVYVGIVALASGFPAGAQFYYQRVDGGAPYDFTFDDAPNEGIQVYGDTTNGNFDERSYFRIFCREYQYTYDDATLADVGLSGTGAFKVSLPIAVNGDLKITADDTAANASPYSDVGVEFFATDQDQTIGAGTYPYRVIIDNTSANLTLEQIYTRVQYLQRQNADIDDGAGTVVGKTADALCYFIGDTLYTAPGVFIDGVLPADSNRVEFADTSGTFRKYPYQSAGTLTFNNILVGGVYRMMFNDLPGSANDWGTSGAITVQNVAAADISGTITGSTIPFSFDYDGNVQGGRTAGEDASVVIFAENPGTAKPVIVYATLTRSKTTVISVVAEADRVYA